MKLLPALAAVIAAVVAVISAIRGDWGVVILGTVICVVAISALLSLRRQPPSPNTDEDL